MVNDYKRQILTVLRSSEKAVSGEMLSGELGISRVAVWKHISSLKEKGYEITSTGTGYTLEGENDFLYPWEFPDYDVTFVPHTTSTMDLAREFRGKKPAEGPLKIITAGSQSSGRGRLGREWVSQNGGLYFTIMTSCNLPPSYAPLESLKTGALIASLLRERYGVSAAVKWPNDILVDGKKIGGVLIEMGGEADRLNYMNIGIGINISNRVPENMPAGSLDSLAAGTVLKKDLLTQFLDSYIRAQQWDPDTVLAFWKKHTNIFGKRVTVHQPFGTVNGTALDIERNGSLLVREGENFHRITAGDVQYE